MRSARLLAATVLVAAFSMGLAGQVAPPATAAGSALTPRTPWGDPDLQGVWNVASGTPLERPATYAGREFLTDEELLQAEKEANERTNADRRLGAGTLADLRREHNEFWFDKRTTILTRRTSLITVPPDGKLPPLTPEAAKKTAPPADEFRGTDGPEDRGLGERCIISNQGGPPILALPGGINEQLLGHKLFLTLSAEHQRVVERFTRTADTLDYQFTIDDPTRWTKSWTAVVPIEKTNGLVYEFACHEGNYGLRNILAVARAQEKIAAETDK